MVLCSAMKAGNNKFQDDLSFDIFSIHVVPNCPAFLPFLSVSDGWWSFCPTTFCPMTLCLRLFVLFFLSNNVWSNFKEKKSC